MTDLNDVRAIASGLRLRDEWVDSMFLAELDDFRWSIDDLRADWRELVPWLIAEREAALDLYTAAVTARRTAVVGTQHRSEVPSPLDPVARFNRWGEQLDARIASCQAGEKRTEVFLAHLASFRADPARNDP